MNVAPHMISILWKGENLVFLKNVQLIYYIAVLFLQLFSLSVKYSSTSIITAGNKQEKLTFTTFPYENQVWYQTSLVLKDSVFVCLVMVTKDPCPPLMTISPWTLPTLLKEICSSFLFGKQTLSWPLLTNNNIQVVVLSLHISIWFCTFLEEKKGSFWGHWIFSAYGNGTLSDMETICYRVLHAA